MASGSKVRLISGGPDMTVTRWTRRAEMTDCGRGASGSTARPFNGGRSWCRPLTTSEHQSD